MSNGIQAKVARFLAAALFLALSACTPSAPLTPTADIAVIQTQAFQAALLTATYGVPTSTVTPTPTATLTPVPPTATPIRTPPALPAIFVSSLLKIQDAPHSYIQNTCQYLKDRWDPQNSEPGTVVMPIMFHSITDGAVVKDNQISAEFFRQLLRDLKMQGFETITTQQLADFMEHNAKIPKRSMILIVDDRHYAQYFEEHFMPFLEENSWTVTNAWISTPLSTKD